MEDELYEMETDVDAYRTLREHAESVEVGPADRNASDYDAIVEIGDESYGVDFESGHALAEKELREAGARVDGSREKRGSRSAGIIAEDMSRDMTVEEAANHGLEPDQRSAPGDEPEAGTGSTNLRYGLGKVEAE